MNTPNPNSQTQPAKQRRNPKIPNSDAELIAKLREDAGPEAGRLLPVLRRLDTWPAPAPTPADTARLIAALQTGLAGAQPPVSNSLISSLLLLRAQLRVVRSEIWLGSALVLALGAFVTLALGSPQSAPETLPFVFVAPIVAALGVAFLYGPVIDPALEVELATPVSPRTVLLARLTLLFSFNLLLAFLASILLSSLSSSISLSSLILTWLAPMTFLSALAFSLIVIFPDPTAGMTTSLLIWGWQIMKSFSPAAAFPLLTHFPDLLADTSRPWLFAVALLLGLLALWLAGREERWIQSTA